MKTITLARGGACQVIPVGFSWTTVFFSFIPSLYRQQWNTFCALFFADIFAFLAVGQEPDMIGYFMVCLIIGRMIVAEMRNRNHRALLEADGWELAINNANIKFKAAHFAAND